MSDVKQNTTSLKEASASFVFRVPSRPPLAKKGVGEGTVEEEVGFTGWMPHLPPHHLISAPGQRVSAGAAAVIAASQMPDPGPRTRTRPSNAQGPEEWG